ncbi:MAG: insulinase family protein [Acidimicrobiaceae bacterium]|nr:insulinase family protein [Acidimicrobiaceae bacterium]
MRAERRKPSVARSTVLLLAAWMLIAAGCADSAQQDDPQADAGNGSRGQPASSSCAPRADGAGNYNADEDRTGSPSTPRPTAYTIAEGAGGDVHVGQLDNGLTYYLDSNWTPHDALTLILAVKAGSIHETEPASGVAHFVEHMMFNGTEEFPGNSVYDEVLEFGLELGPDLNAFTTYDETFYVLNGLSDDPDAVQTGFKVLSQWAHAATISADAVAGERGVVREEYRLRRETSEGVSLDSSLRLLTEGTPYEQRPPIGEVAAIEETTAAELREFYDAWYVPANMAVVAVGDLTVDELKALVEEHFGSITAQDPPTAPDTNSPLRSGTRIEITETPGQADPRLSLYLQVPVWDPATTEGERGEQLELLLAYAIGIRLSSAHEQGLLSQTDEPVWWVYAPAAGLRHFATTFQAADLHTAAGEVWSVLLSLADQGFGEQELATAKSRVLSELQQVADHVEVAHNIQYAYQYANHYLRGTSLETSPERLARVEALLDTIEVEELTDHLRSILAQSGPLVSVNAQDVAQVPTVDEFRAALEGARAINLGPASAPIDALISPPGPADPVTEGPISELSAGFYNPPYEWKFANGARVNFGNSADEGVVRLEAVSLGGWSTLEPGERPLAEFLAPTAVASSGLGRHTSAQIAQHLATKRVSLRPFITETTEGFRGSAPPAEVETLFALLHLLICDARVDEQAFNSVVESARRQAADLPGGAATQMDVAYNEARFGDRIEWFDPVASTETLDEVTAESLLDVYRSRLGNAEGLLVAVSGDLELEAVDRLARRYIGTLPSGEADTFTNRRPAQPDGIVRTEVVLAEDAGPTGITFYHETLRPTDPQTETVLKVLEAVLNARLLNDVREDLGASYSVTATLEPRFTPESAVISVIDAGAAPESIDEIREEILRIFNDLATSGPDATELADAESVVSNRLSHLVYGVEALLRRLVSADSEISDLTPSFDGVDVTADEVEALAAALYGTGRHIEITRVLS